MHVCKEPLALGEPTNTCLFLSFDASPAAPPWEWQALEELQSRRADAKSSEALFVCCFDVKLKQPGNSQEEGILLFNTRQVVIQ